MHGSPERREKNILVIHSLNLIWFYEWAQKNVRSSAAHQKYHPYLSPQKSRLQCSGALHRPEAKISITATNTEKYEHEKRSKTFCQDDSNISFWKKKIQTVSERNKKVKVLSWQTFFLFCLFLRHNMGENNLDLTLKKMDHLNLYFWPASQGFRTDGIDRTLWDSARLVTLYPSLLDIKTQVPVSASTLLCQRGQLHTAEQTIKLSKQ